MKDLIIEADAAIAGIRLTIEGVSDEAAEEIMSLRTFIEERAYPALNLKLTVTFTPTQDVIVVHEKHADLDTVVPSP